MISRRDFDKALYNHRIFLYRNKDYPGVRVDFTGFDLRHIKTIRSYNLQEAKFSGANLLGMTFEDCCFHECDFTNANLSFTTFINVDLSRANFENANLESVQAKFINFEYSNLENANLENACMNHTVMARCNFTNASFKNTSMLCSDIQDADFTTELHNAQTLKGIITNKNKLSYLALNPAFPEESNYIGFKR
jgi:uncharacterized protein YjbI with pentapeptide repeats